MYRSVIVTSLLLTSALLSGCTSTSEFLADSLPTWAGGLPPDAPPRPSDPRYPEYERSLREKTAIDAPSKSIEAQPKSDVAKPEPVK
jgi:hypothetical protein